MRLHSVPKSHFEKKLLRKSWLRCCGKQSYATMPFYHAVHAIGIHGDAFLGTELVPARNQAH